MPGSGRCGLMVVRGVGGMALVPWVWGTPGSKAVVPDGGDGTALKKLPVDGCIHREMSCLELRAAQIYSMDSKMDNKNAFFV